MKKERLEFRIGHNKIWVWTHDAYIKVSGCKIGNNPPLIYTSIMKLPFMWPKQVIWPLYRSYDLSTHFIKDLSMTSYYFITNTIFLDKAYDLSTHLFKNNNKRQDLMWYSP